VSTRTAFIACSGVPEMKDPIDKVIELIDKYRAGEAGNREINELFEVFTSREGAIMRMARRSNGLYDAEDLLANYKAGVIKGIIGKKLDGQWIADLSRKETVISRIFQQGRYAAMDFLHNVSGKKLKKTCGQCGTINHYHADECTNCADYIGIETSSVTSFTIDVGINDTEGGENWLENNIAHSTIDGTIDRIDAEQQIERLRHLIASQNSDYLGIIDMLLDREIQESPNYLKEIGHRLGISPQAVNAKIKRMKKYLALHGFIFQAI